MAPSDVLQLCPHYLRQHDNDGDDGGDDDDDDDGDDDIEVCDLPSLLVKPIPVPVRIHTSQLLHHSVVFSDHDHDHDDGDDHNHDE